MGGHKTHGLNSLKQVGFLQPHWTGVRFLEWVGEAKKGETKRILFFCPWPLRLLPHSHDPEGCSFNAPTPIYNLKQSEKLPWAGFVIKCQAELNRWPRHWLNALETPPGTGHILDPLWKLITYWQSRTTVLTLTVNLQLRVTGNSIRNSCGLL